MARVTREKTPAALVRLPRNRFGILDADTLTIVSCSFEGAAAIPSEGPIVGADLIQASKDEEHKRESKSTTTRLNTTLAMSERLALCSAGNCLWTEWSASCNELCQYLPETNEFVVWVLVH